MYIKRTDSCGFVSMKLEDQFIELEEHLRLIKFSFNVSNKIEQ